MAEVELSKVVFTNVSYDLDVEGDKDFQLEITNEIKFNVSIDPKDSSFLLVFKTTVTEPENKFISILIKANAFFKCDEKLSTYDDVIKEQCFPLVFSKIAEKIDQILETLEYPKLNILSSMPKNK